MKLRFEDGTVIAERGEPLNFIANKYTGERP